MSGSEAIKKKVREIRKQEVAVIEAGEKQTMDAYFNCRDEKERLEF